MKLCASSTLAMHYSSRNAFSLFELLLTLSIISIVIIGATQYFSTNIADYKITKAAEDIRAIRKAAAEWVLNQPDYKGGSTDCSAQSNSCISMTLLNAAGLLPEDLNSSQDPWGGTYAVSPATNNPTQLAVGMVLEPSVCNNLVSIIRPQAISAACTGLNGSIFSAVFG